MKKIFYLKIILPALLLSQIGCKSLRGAPEWLENPKSAYPESRFLVAVGAGDTRRAAENAAAGNLARIFEAHIESDERLLDQTHETNTSFERTTDFTADISILSSQTLYNIQHAEAWKDKKGRYHAVAYFDRRQTASIYRGKIDELTERVNFYIAQAVQAEELLKKYAALRAANRNAAENEYLLGQLKVIHPSSASAAAPGYNRNELRKALADTAKKINVQISIAGDTERRMTAILEELITGYGFVIGKPAVLDIGGLVEVTDTGERTRGMVFVRYELALRIQDGRGNIIASVSDKGREAHRSLDQARIRSFRTMETKLKAGGSQRLDAYFDSLIDQQ